MNQALGSSTRTITYGNIKKYDIGFGQTMTEAMNRRPRSMAEMLDRQGRTWSAEDRAASIASYRSQPTDIIISPYAKCGTTWLQQLLHTLRTRGDMDFDDISRVVPWIETAKALSLDLDAPQRGRPRLFKSHLPYDLVPKGPRHVVSFRDPKDAILSDYHFMEGWWFEPGSISLAEFIERPLTRRGTGRDYWHHLLTWWGARTSPEVLLLSYERMSADPAKHVRAIAKFAAIDLDDELLRLTLEHSSLAFMLKHKDRFNDRLMRELSEGASGLPKGSDSAKVREGKVGAHRAEMSPEIAARIDAVWTELVTPVTGFADYAAFEAALPDIGRSLA